MGCPQLWSAVFLAHHTCPQTHVMMIVPIMVERVLTRVLRWEMIAMGLGDRMLMPENRECNIREGPEAEQED